MSFSIAIAVMTKRKHNRTQEKTSKILVQASRSVFIETVVKYICNLDTLK